MIFPTEWQIVRSNEVLDIRDGTHDTPEYTSTGIPLITSKHLTEEGIDFDNSQFISQSDHELIKKRSGVNKGDILYSMIGSIGNIAIVETAQEFSIKNVALFKFKNSPFYNKFFFYLLKSQFVQGQIDNAQRGGTQKFVSLSILRNLKLPLPPLEEQYRIAAVLDKADRLRQLDRQLVARYDQLTQSVFLDMFGDPVRNGKGFPKGTIRDVVNEVKYGTSKPSEANGSFPYLRMNNITYKGYWNLTDLKYINLTAEEESKYLARKGDLIFKRTNSKELVGKTSVYKFDYSMALAGYLIRVRTNEKAIAEYISAYLNSLHGKLILQNMCKNIVGMANINAQELQNIEILIPPIELQNQFAHIVQNIESQKAKAEASLQKSEVLFNALLQRAFRGELFAEGAESEETAAGPVAPGAAQLNLF